MDISICILTHNQPNILPLCVASCYEEINRAGVDGEVIVIDNASIDKYPERLRKRYPDVRIIRNEENLSFSAANNQGVRVCSGDKVLIFNDDALLQHGALRIMLDVMSADLSIGAVGARLENPDGSAQIDYMNDRFPHVRGVVLWLLRLNLWMAHWEWARKHFTLTRDPGASGETEVLVGACLLARRDAVLEVGAFDEQFHYLFEDVDLCFKMKKRGWRIWYVSEARVTHLGSASLRAWDSSRFIATFMASMLYYFKKNAKPWQCWLLKFLLLGIIFLRMVFVVLRDVFFHRSWSASLRGHLAVLRMVLRRTSGTRTLA